MNIKQAKQEIIDTVQAYLLKNEYDEYVIPRVHQRPVLLLGAPGIGKTQIMEQAARECGVALVAYTITHHTRQSAIGLPFISKKEYGGREYSATEYTMSEIVASIYDRMRETGLTEGILFIDEINCVSETLAPAMLQFLQCKTFGNHEIPKGWVIVAAGNPPEYNKSVRDFDVVTLDRVKKITVEPDYRVWKEYVTILKKEQTENWEEAFDIVKNAFGEYRASWDAVWDESGSTLEYAFDFMEAAFYNSQEMVIFVSGINTDYSCVRFLETYECERYIRYNRDLLFEDASQEIRRRIEEL